MTRQSVDWSVFKSLHIYSLELHGTIYLIAGVESSQLIFQSVRWTSCLTRLVVNNNWEKNPVNLHKFIHYLTLQPMFFFFIPRTIRTFCLVALVSVLTGLHCMSVSRRILRNWVLQNWFYPYRRIPWKTETESRKKAESAGDDNWRYTKGHCLNPYYTVEPLYNDKLGRTEKNGRCREVAVSGDSTVVDNRKERPYLVL